MPCPALPIGDDASLSAALTAIDCQLDGAVASAYGRLFASGGALSTALTAILTIYIAILAFGLLTGRTRLTLSAMAPKFTALCLVLTFATSWQAYHVVIHTLMSAGPDQIAATVLGAREGATHAFAGRVDTLFNGVLDASRAVENAGETETANTPLAKNLIWFSALELLLSTVGRLVVSRIVLAILLALGPVFIVLALFSNTRGLFEGWLRTTLAFALAPMMVVLAGGAVMGALGPIISAIADDPAHAVTNLRPVIMLFLGANVYAALVLAAGWTAVSLTGGWRTRRERSAQSAPDAPRVAIQSGDTRAANGAAGARDRAAELATILMRERPAAAASPALLAPDPSTDSVARTAPRRRIGLGQTFRKSAA